MEYVWEEASGCLGEVLSLPVESVKLEQVEKAEAALLSIRRLLDQGKEERDEGKGESDEGKGESDQGKGESDQGKWEGE